eukprot:NODE_156_length_15158_cov_0.791553.p9 type:complete len:108 gc:universal NODE_156_length_15158_cov_0.791553:9285-8962(-)
MIENDFLILFDDRIVIKWFYFPTGGNKTIYYKDIEYISTAVRLNLKWYELKSWGQGLSMIWWACDMGREFKTNEFDLIIKVKDDILMKGCSANVDVITRLAEKVHLQ